jgi:hypothetical protein
MLGICYLAANKFVPLDDGGARFSKEYPTRTWTVTKRLCWPLSISSILCTWCRYCVHGANSVELELLRHPSIRISSSRSTPNLRRNSSRYVVYVHFAA